LLGSRSTSYLFRLKKTHPSQGDFPGKQVRPVKPVKRVRPFGGKTPAARSCEGAIEVPAQH
ncbi:MAG: hypothetical protein P8J33_15190, partial [Pirellulaceae bacterium]|nr:hypothetical protein [Pirellulaceae bacterium]